MLLLRRVQLNLYNALTRVMNNPSLKTHPKILLGLGGMALVFLAVVAFLQSQPRTMITSRSPTTTKLSRRPVAPPNAGFLRTLGLISLITGGGTLTCIIGSELSKDDSGEELLQKILSVEGGLRSPPPFPCHLIEESNDSPLPQLEPSSEPLEEVHGETDEQPESTHPISPESPPPPFERETHEPAGYYQAPQLLQLGVMDEFDKVVEGHTLSDLFLSATISPMSLVIAGESNVGKSTFLKALLYTAWDYGSMQSRPPEFLISAIKKGNYLGIQKQKHGLFLNNIPGRDFTGICSVLQLAQKGYQQRCDEFPEDDPRIKGLPHLISVFDDFTTITLNLQGAGSDKPVFDFLSQTMPSAYTLYRSHLVRLFVIAHSFNVKALMLPDASIRESLGVIALGRTSREVINYQGVETETQLGGFGVIEKVLSNPHAAGNNKEVVTQFNELRPIAEKTEQTLALSSLGGGWRIGFVPKGYVKLAQKQIIKENQEANHGTSQLQPQPHQSDSKLQQHQLSPESWETPGDLWGE